MKKGLIPIAVGTAVTAAGIALDSKSNKKHLIKKKVKNRNKMGSAMLIGAGAAHILLGGIDAYRY